MNFLFVLLVFASFQSFMGFRTDRRMMRIQRIEATSACSLGYCPETPWKLSRTVVALLGFMTITVFLALILMSSLTRVFIPVECWPSARDLYIVVALAVYGWRVWDLRPLAKTRQQVRT